MRKDVLRDFDSSHCSVAAPLTFGSLFAGIGGFDLGFERAGMVCKWQVEINDYAQKVLAKHWPKVHREADIKTVGKHNLEYVDVICGGFPCQDISYAGRGAGLDGERSGLFFEAIRVVRELQPRVVVLENVSALLTRGLDQVLGTLASLGYDAEWHCIPAAYVGAPHIRDRVFVLAYMRSVRRNSFCKIFKKMSTSCFLSRDEWIKESTDIHISDGSICRTRRMPNANVFGVADGISNWVDRLKGLGNAVVPQVAELVGGWVVERLA
jgi:DNA (cytosine-5)-methyltransferase 1